MALTKATLSGTVDNIKQGWTKFNDLIDDLLSISNGLGASQIGIEDTAGNLAAVNVETAIAEIYATTDDSVSLSAGFGENSATTTGLTWGFNAGRIRVDNTITSVAAATILLTDNATNYVEVNQSGTMTKNTDSFTSGYIAVRQVVCSGGVQTSTDKRTSFYADPFADVVNYTKPDLTGNAYTVVSTDSTVVIDDGDAQVTGTVVVALPALAGDGRVITVVKYGASQTVQLDGNGSEEISGSTTQDIEDQWHTMTVQDISTTWIII
jgi:hypothetical protein